MNELIDALQSIGMGIEDNWVHYEDAWIKFSSSDDALMFAQVTGGLRVNDLQVVIDTAQVPALTKLIGQAFEAKDLRRLPQ